MHPIYREVDILAADWKKIKQQERIDFLIGFVHWDFEQSYIPAPDTTATALRLLLEYDFDFICGHGPHVLQTVEVVKGSKVVAYSAGNLCSERGNWQTKMGGLIEINLSKKKLANYKVHPYLQEQQHDESVMIVPLEHTHNTAQFRDRLAKLFFLRPLLTVGNKQGTYRMHVITSDGPLIATDAKVFVTMTGSNGTSGEKELPQTRFLCNSVDEFYLATEQVTKMFAC